MCLIQRQFRVSLRLLQSKVVDSMSTPRTMERARRDFEVVLVDTAMKVDDWAVS
jgi:hypothetical protein